MTTKFLTDDAGNASSMRLMCMLALFASIAFGYLVMRNAAPNPEQVAMVTMFLVGAFAPKAIQKYAEK